MSISEKLSFLILFHSTAFLLFQLYNYKALQSILPNKYKVHQDSSGSLCRLSLRNQIHVSQLTNFCPDVKILAFTLSLLK